MMNDETFDLKLGTVQNVLHRCIASAMLDIIDGPSLANEDRTYQFIGRWVPGASLFKIDTGSGDTGTIVFLKENRAFTKGFNHESKMTTWNDEMPAIGQGFDATKLWPGLFEGLPRDMYQLLRQPELEIIATTFCYWNTDNGEVWHRGPFEMPNEPPGDGATSVLGDFLMSENEYLKSLKAYFEFDVDDGALRQIISLAPLNIDLLAEFNRVSEHQAIFELAKSIGWPRFH